jgi:hypothetical protein
MDRAFDMNDRTGRANGENDVPDRRMTSTEAPVFEVDDLRALVPLAADGSSRVFAASDVLINRAWPAVYREYLPPVRGAIDLDALRRAVVLLSEIGDADARWLSERAAWPMALVTRAGAVQGYLTRQVPDPFTRPAADAGALLGELAPPAGGDAARLAFLRDLVDTLAALARWGVVPGDLSPATVLFTAAGRPRCFLTGCDTMRIAGVAPRTVPDGAYTDAALGRFIVRVLAADPTADAARIADRHPDLAHLAGRGDATPADWLGPLRDAAAVAAGEPRPVAGEDPPTSDGVSRPPAVSLAKRPAPAGRPGPRPPALPLPAPVPAGPAPSSPAPALPAPRTPPARAGRRNVAIVASALAALALAVTGVVAVRLAGDGGEERSTPAAGSTVSTAPSPSGPAPGGSGSADPHRVGLVDVSAVSDDPRSVDIGVMFDQYFSAINAKDYRRAIEVYDPAGVVDPANPADQRHFEQGVSTTADSEVRLLAIQPGDGARVVAHARVAFRSNQQAGFGPRGRESETCTRWAVTYALTVPFGGQYRILGASAATNTPC